MHAQLEVQAPPESRLPPSANTDWLKGVAGRGPARAGTSGAGGAIDEHNEGRYDIADLRKELNRRPSSHSEV